MRRGLHHSAWPSARVAPFLCVSTRFAGPSTKHLDDPAGHDSGPLRDVGKKWAESGHGGRSGFWQLPTE